MNFTPRGFVIPIEVADVTLPGSYGNLREMKLYLSEFANGKPVVDFHICLISNTEYYPIFTCVQAVSLSLFLN